MLEWVVSCVEIPKVFKERLLPSPQAVQILISSYESFWVWEHVFLRIEKQISPLILRYSQVLVGSNVMAVNVRTTETEGRDGPVVDVNNKTSCWCTGLF